MEIRQPAVAGAFYPDDPGRLTRDLTAMLEAAECGVTDPLTIKALVVPHAGYVYSGPVAASAYKLLPARRHQINRVVLLGPSHRVAFRGVAVPSAEQFRTPLGDIPLDGEALQRILTLPGVVQRDDAHDREHSLEVQLPFLQTVLADFRLVPLVVGDADPELVTAVLEALWGDAETLILISSDLSHYLPYELAKQVDGQTSRLIEQRRPPLGGNEACGCRPLNALLRIAGQKGLQVRTLDLRNSGDTAGSRDQVVGYGSYAFCQ
ncbi:MAG: AmmeMemoRadiSam system protein B [Gammaproteobacteria bacterium]|nr:AmmeMemoRadiSam system protein B [Pseudomonadales bacterium]MCP5347927.1 AmmeMemoRadiSam system protein B [Pseudomonadales bacterium]